MFIPALRKYKTSSTILLNQYHSPNFLIICDGYYTKN